MNEQDSQPLARFAEEKMEERPEGCKSQEEAKHQPEPPFWAVATNIVQEHEFGENHEIRSGTKHFRPGAKVYVVLRNARGRVEVVGHSRGSRIIKIWTRREYLKNLSVELVYSATFVRHLTNYSWSWSSATGYEFYSWKGDKESRLLAEGIAGENARHFERGENLSVN